MSKQRISLLLAVCMLFCLSACDTTKTNVHTSRIMTDSQANTAQSMDEIDSQADNTQSMDENKITKPENSQALSNIEDLKENDTASIQTPANQSKPANTTNQPAHTHSYSDATCTSPPKCSCGATIGIAIGHQFASATCTSPQICSRCGVINGNALGHNYSDANCISPKTCIRCGNTQGSALGHNYINHKCSRCGQLDPDSLPIGLEQLHVIDSNRDYYTYKNETIEDTFGNRYVGYHCFKELVETAYAIFNLNHKYSKFSCDIITTCQDATFSIYVDNVLKYQTTSLSNLSGPVHVDVDVKNGQQLKVVATDNTYSWSVAGYVVNAQLIK